MSHEDAMVVLLESGIGYLITLFHLLDLRPLEDGTFAVTRHEYNEADPANFHFAGEKIFNDAREAVRFFEQQRRTHELGHDFERE